MNNGDRAKWFLMDQLKWATLVTHSGSLYDVASWPLKDSFSTRQGWQKSLNNKTGTHKLSPRKFQGRKDGLFSTCRESAAPLNKIIYVYLKYDWFYYQILGNPKNISVFYLYTNNSSHDHRAPSSNMEKEEATGSCLASSLFQTFSKKWEQLNSARPAARAAALNQCLASVRAQWSCPGLPTALAWCPAHSRWDHGCGNGDGQSRPRT